MFTPSDERWPLRFKGSIALETPLGAVLSDSRVRLLEAIERHGSLNRAAREVPLSYKAAWDALDALNNLAPQPLVERSTGGVHGGGTRLTGYARQLVALYRAMESSQQDILNQLTDLPAEADAQGLRTLIRRMAMRTSARNQFAGRIHQLTDRGGLVDVQLDLGQGDRITATITPESVEAMALAAGVELFALIKAPWVRLSAQPPRRLATRNQLAGQLDQLRPGSTHTGATLLLPSGRSLSAVVSNTQASELRTGQAVWASFDCESVVLVRFD